MTQPPAVRATSDFPAVEAIRELVTLGQTAQAHKLSVLTPSCEPPDTYLLHSDRTGEFTHHIASPKPLQITINSTASLLSLANSIAPEPLHLLAAADVSTWPNPSATSAPSTTPTAELVTAHHPSPRFFYNAERIQLVWDCHTGRRHIATMPLPLQEQFIALQSIAKRDYAQREFSVLLRTLFRNSMSSDLIAAIRTLKWAIGAGEDATVQPGKESVSRHIAAEVRGEFAIPDEYSLQVGVYNTQESRYRQYPVLCAIDILQATKSFRLIPVANALEQAMEAALVDMVLPLMNQTRFPVYFGTAQ